jgi:putative FmdB family regulatory protein
MPIFDYQCEACGHTFDALQKVGEGPLRKCPKCGKLKLKKQMAAPNFHLKGSGWYKTDFKDKSAKKDGDKAASKSETKSEGDKPGHTLDSGAAHTHSADCGHSSEKSSGHSHSHGGHSHSHGPGGHKH